MKVQLLASKRCCYTVVYNLHCHMLTDFQMWQPAHSDLEEYTTVLLNGALSALALFRVC